MGENSENFTYAYTFFLVNSLAESLVRKVAKHFSVVLLLPREVIALGT